MTTETIDAATESEQAEQRPLLHWDSADDGRCWFADSAMMYDEMAALVWQFDIDEESAKWLSHETSSILLGVSEKDAPDFPDIEAAKAWAEGRERELRAAQGGPGNIEPDKQSEPEPATAKPGSLPASEDARDQHLRDIEEAEIIVGRREEEWEALKLETKSAKDSFDAAVEKLRRIIKRSAGPGPLFEQAKSTGETPVIQPGVERERLVWIEDGGALTAMNTIGVEIKDEDAGTFKAAWFIEREGENFLCAANNELAAVVGDFPPAFPTIEDAKAWCQKRDDELYAAAQAVSPSTVNDAPDARLSIRIDSLGLPAALAKKLAENKPPLVTIGDVADWCGQRSTAHGGNNEITDIPGVGAGKAEKIQAALDGVWFMPTNGSTPVKPPATASAAANGNTGHEKPHDDIPVADNAGKPQAIATTQADSAATNFIFQIQLGDDDADLAYSQNADGSWNWSGRYSLGVSNKAWGGTGHYESANAAVLDGANEMLGAVSARIENSSGAVLNNAKAIGAKLAEVIRSYTVNAGEAPVNADAPAAKRTRGKRAK